MQDPRKYEMNKGFTLIELLVVIAIIAVLSLIGINAYNIFIKNAHDARRKSDLIILQSALEQYYNDQRFYPQTLTFDGTSLTNATGNPTAPAVPRIYLNTVPIGPIGVSEYTYQSYNQSNVTSCDNSTATQCVKYCLYAKLENGSMSNPPSLCLPYPTTVDPVPPYNYAVTSP